MAVGVAFSVASLGEEDGTADARAGLVYLLVPVRQVSDHEAAAVAPVLADPLHQPLHCETLSAIVGGEMIPRSHRLTRAWVCCAPKRSSCRAASWALATSRRLLLLRNRTTSPPRI